MYDARYRKLWLALGTVHKNLLGGPDAKRGPLKFVTLVRGVVHCCMQDSMLPGCYGVLNDEISYKLAQNRLIWLFCLTPTGLRALPLHPSYAGVVKKITADFPVKSSLHAFLWGWPIIFMAKRGGWHFLRSEGGPKNFCNDNFCISPPPLQVLQNGPLHHGYV